MKLIPITSLTVFDDVYDMQLKLHEEKIFYSNKKNLMWNNLNKKNH